MNIELKKYHLLPVFLLSLLPAFSSCEKNIYKDPPIDPGVLRYDITDKWEIFGSGGGLAGHGTTLHFDIMSLESDYKYRFSRNDTTIEFGDWALIKNVSQIFPGGYKVRYLEKGKIGNGAKPMTAFELIIEMHSPDTLMLIEDSYDGFSYYFTRE